MAAEPTPQQSVEETATPVVLRAQTDDGSQDVDIASNNALTTSSVPSGAHTPVIDELVNSAEVSISGGSDTEASRPDLAKKDDKGHSRTASVKKPTTFKSVSVNKTFLASKASSSTSVPKVGDKPTTPVPSAATPSTSSTPKPRLVAKSVAGIRDASKVSSQNGRPAPDGNAVWNKNRPVPVPDPKKFTDEELAKIGIHMANRIHQNDAKGHSSAWADIDDDDEDWAAPEAITWTDGTKTTIPHVDDTAATAEPPLNKIVKLVEKSRSPAPPLSEPSMPNPPAAAAPPPLGPPVTTQPLPAPSSASSPSAKPQFMASGNKGLVLKGASSEKPTLVAKPPAPPTPVKSPWAALPPVSKVSPMDASTEQSQRSFAPPGSGYGLRGGPPTAREIAADDFSRSPRRDNQHLYNSHSGRYEPVPERRGVPRPEFAQRQPAVLQRPMHTEAQGPAEPSAAFQTSHTSSGGYGRRRTSSNVSGGSGSFQRLNRLHDQSAPPADMPSLRRSSLASAGEHPLSPHSFTAPAGPELIPRIDTSPHQPRASPAMSAAAPHIPEVPEPVAPQQSIENTVEFQKRLMQERRAEAIKRRQEEEAQEEAARKERLAKKLAALGPAPERKSTKKEEPLLEAPPVPVAPASEATDKPHTQAPPEAQPIQPAKPAVEAKSPLLPKNAQPNAQIEAQPPVVPEQLSPPPQENKNIHPWQPRMPNQPERIWGSGNQAPRNVWGAPNNDRSLGNGTFGATTGFNAQPPQQAPVQGSRPPPGPIAPPRSAAPPGAPSRLGPIGPPQRNEPRATDDKEKNRARWSQAVMTGDEEHRVERRERQIEMERDMRARGLNYADLGSQIQDAWTETNEDGKVVKKREDATYGSAAAPWPVAHPGSPEDTRTAPPPPAGPSNTIAGSSQSRFFPSGRDGQQLEPLAPDTGRPIEEDAFGGDTLHPSVAPPIRVRLPPAPPAITTSASTSGRSAQAAPGWGQRPQSRDDGSGRGSSSRPTFTTANPGFSQGANSQIVDRIKNLFADKPSSVSSSTKTMLSQPVPAAPATVSLPFIYAPTTIVEESSYVTKTMDEDCFEEQEMGSLPPVHLPTDIPDAAYNLAKAPPRQDRRLLQVIASTVDALSFYPDARNIFIQLPNSSERKSVSRGNMRSPNPRRGSRGPSSFGSSYRGGSRNSSEQAAMSGTNSSGGGGGGGGGRGGRGYRGRSDNWGRAAAPAIQSQ
ncbi:hypothetical protein BD289DRAFT_481566 [Coniella lustricola]|uniref:Uncharacterized protein n=1 Tax=Coniella lustricola TaxID=2025994 RepID=A0A2T3ABS1_9PEZI|nr:hypothetical protein BD289DRAFT_481566 [Coniella lustricola]